MDNDPGTNDDGDNSEPLTMYLNAMFAPLCDLRGLSTSLSVSRFNPRFSFAYKIK